jgi:hypothetical protein
MGLVMLRLLRPALALLLLLVGLSLPAARAAEPVDLLLVLAADVSRSVDAEKFQLQREGYAAAVADRACSTPSAPAATGASRFCSWNGRASATRRS